MQLKTSYTSFEDNHLSLSYMANYLTFDLDTDMNKYRDRYTGLRLCS